MILLTIVGDIIFMNSVMKLTLKILFYFTILLSLFLPQAYSYTIPAQGSEALIWGKWKYVGFIYKGQFNPPLNPDLILTFEFFKNGQNILRWSYLNEDGFCERKGEYSYDGKNLTDKIIWVNPKNSMECQKDPDMIKGRTQITPLLRVNDQIHLEIALSDENLIYILALNQPAEPQPASKCKLQTPHHSQQ